MGHSYSSVEAVMGQLFDNKHKKKSGGQERPRRGHSSAQRLTRTAQAQRPSAVFKLIRSGGTTSRAGLKGQLEYVFDKADDVLDAQGRYEGQGALSNADMNRVTRLWEGDMWGTAKTGYTSHLLLSYPIGTAVKDVSAITKAVCEEMFQSGDVRYDYVAGIHTDRDHPHAHVIVNRRGEDGRLMTLRKGTDLSYETFRDSMVIHGERRGVYMESGSRFEKGLTDRAPTAREIYQSKDDDREAKSTPRSGAALAYALKEVDEAAALYSAVAVLAENDGFSTLTKLCTMAASHLSSHQPLQGNLPMDGSDLSEAEAFDKKLEQLDGYLTQARDGIDLAAPSARPALQRAYSDIMTEATKLNPKAMAAQSFNQDAGKVSPYGAGFMIDREALDTPDIRANVVESLEGTGIDPVEVLARMEVTAINEYLEQRWALSDMEAIARQQGLDMSDAGDFRQVNLGLNDAYENIRLGLIEAGVAHDRHGELTEAEVVHEPVSKSAAILKDAAERFLAKDKINDEDERRVMVEALRDYLGPDQARRTIDGGADDLDQITGNHNASQYLRLELLKDERLQGRDIDQKIMDGLSTDVAKVHAPKGRDRDGLEH